MPVLHVTNCYLRINCYNYYYYGFVLGHAYPCLLYVCSERIKCASVELRKGKHMTPTKGTVLIPNSISKLTKKNQHADMRARTSAHRPMQSLIVVNTPVSGNKK